LLLLATLSRQLTRELVALPDMRFDFSPSGKLVLQPDDAAMDGARRQMAVQAALGSEQRALSRDECLAVEPALRHVAHRIAGGILTESEEAGDARLFCEALAARLASGNAGVAFQMRTRARQLVRAEGRIRAVVTDAGTFEADSFVLALGTGARRLLRPLGMELPIYPLKGYSLTLPITDEAAAPRLSVTDSAAKVVYARLGRRLRVAGLRPATPTGLPILGRTPGAANLWLNVGQGSLGFTLAMGSAAVVAALMAGRPTPIPAEGFAPD
jgi:D-amino-acid dehydrogenase